MTTARRSIAGLFAPLLVVALVAAACGGSAGNDDLDAGQSQATTGTLRVFAAASLTDAFGELATTFERSNPGTVVELNLAGSSSLRTQVEAGAPVDVVATANQEIIDQLAAAGLVAEATTFATNGLQLVTPAGNPAEVSGIEDLADDDLFVGLCAQEVPCGALADEALRAAGITPSIDTREPDVRALLTKVTTAELDAAIVYRTDVVAAGDTVLGVDLGSDPATTASYPIALATEAGNAASAQRFVELVLSERGQQILADHGFGRA